MALGLLESESSCVIKLDDVEFRNQHGNAFARRTAEHAGYCSVHGGGFGSTDSREDYMSHMSLSDTSLRNRVFSLPAG